LQAARGPSGRGHIQPDGLQYCTEEHGHGDDREGKIAVIATMLNTTLVLTLLAAGPIGATSGARMGMGG
jgi:hypothetical protein